MREILAQQTDMISHADINASVRIALTFDKCIVAATNNDNLLALYEQFEDLYFLMALYSNQKSVEEYQQNLHEHTKILETIENGDMDGARHWLFVHYNKHM